MRNLLEPRDFRLTRRRTLAHCLNMIFSGKYVSAFPDHALERDEFRKNRHRALTYYLSMIFSENREPLFRIML